MTEKDNEKLFNHLIRDDGHEDLCFAFYNLSKGETRKTGIITNLLLPGNGDRNLHGNVSFNSKYFDRATAFALKHKLGICFIHSHPSAGWQGMSKDDVKAEKMLAPRVKAVTGLPLVGMTLGTDNTWSARFWEKEAPRVYKRHWCQSVRVVGKSLKVSFKERRLSEPPLKEIFERTTSAWGSTRQEDITRLKVGIIGLGSVGVLVAEALMRTGVQSLTFIDFDIIELKNLDRLNGASKDDVGKLKVEFQKDRLVKSRLLKSSRIKTYSIGIEEQEGIKAALDCDVLFSCVDRSMPRFLLDCISFAHLIPVIDGGIEASIRFDLSNIDQARWKAHTTGPGRICMQCLGQYTPEEVSLEQSGLLDDISYIAGLPKDHYTKRGENVFGFSLSLAAMEMQQFLSLVLNPRGVHYGPKEMDFITGSIDSNFDNKCMSDCGIFSLLGQGDKCTDSLILEKNQHRKAAFRV